MLSIIPLSALGLAVGWLVNYLADVLPRGRRLAVPVCAYCGQNRALLAHPLWPQRCPHCGQRPAEFLRTLLVNAIGVGATVWMGFSPPTRLGFSWGVLVLALFLLVVVIDVEHRLILHPVSLAGALLGLGLGISRLGIVSTLIGGAVGFAVMFLLYQFGTVFSRVVSRMRGEPIEEVALGFGDVNLAGVLGLMLGWPVILVGLILGILAGGAFSVVYLTLSLVLRRYQSFAAVPYAPFLVFGGSLLLFFPDATRNLLLFLSPLLATVV